MSRVRSWISWITLPSLWTESIHFVLTAPSRRRVETVALDPGVLRLQAAIRLLVFRRRIDGHLRYRHRLGKALRHFDRLMPKAFVYRWVILPLYIVQLGRVASSSVGRWGDRLRDENNFSLRRQFGMVMRWCLRSEGLLPHSFYKYDGHRPATSTFASAAVDPFQIELIVELTSTMRRPLVACGQAAEAMTTLQDKEALKVVCRDHGVPVVDTVAIFERGSTVWKRETTELPEQDLFLKPIGGGQGVGAARAFFLPRERRYRFEQPVRPVPGAPAFPDEPLTADELIAWAQDLSKRVPCMLEPRLLPHPVVARWTGVPTLATIRIMSMIGRSGRSTVIGGVFKCPVRDVPIDNVCAGAMAIPICPVTGRVTGAAKLKSGHEEVWQHPITGASIWCLQIPHIPEAMGMCQRLHEAIATIEEQAVPVLGWDMAIVEEGPILIEGNQFIDLLQDLTGKPLWGDDAFSRTVLSHLEPIRGVRIPLDPARLPSLVGRA